MAWGLKPVKNRRDDALSRIGWDQLEALLAEHYSQQGYLVDHVGTGRSGHRFDGGIDLKLRKGDAYILVQSKHWNAYQVTHNAVHELLRVMVNEEATGAILVTSGEFTRSAIEAAVKHGHVQLVDGDELRSMLGVLPDQVPASSRANDFIRTMSASPNARRIGRAVNDRMISELEGLIRGGRRPGFARTSAVAGLWLIALKFAGALLLFLFMAIAFNDVFKGIATLPSRAPSPGLMQPSEHAQQTTESMNTSAGNTAAQAANAPVYRPPTPEEIRESKRQADEAMKVLAPNTPEM